MPFLFQPPLSREELEAAIDSTGRTEPKGAADELPSNEDAKLKEFLAENFLYEEPAAEESDSAAADVEPHEAATQIVSEPSNEASAETAEGAEPQAPLDTSSEVSKELLQVVSSEWAFEEKLAGHREWVESQGASGRKADFCGAQLEGVELISVNLRYADLQDANLTGADLLLADLRDACLVRTNLQEACLVGANLEGANMEGASLDTSMGLVPRQLAGANLREANLPPHILEFPAQAEFQDASQTAIRVFSGTIAMSALSWLMIWKTRDVQLLANSAILPFLHSQAAAATLPTAEIYLIAPALLLAIYLVFQYHLQRMWDSVLELPAIFPNGRMVGDGGPRILRGLLRAHFRWLNPDPTWTRTIEKTLCVLLAYWIVPITLVLFWARYLTMQEIHGSLLHVFFAAVAMGVALFATTKVGRKLEKWTVRGKPTRAIFRNWKMFNPAPVTVGYGILLSLLSLGTVLGVPHNRSRAPQFALSDIRRWAPTFLWAAGYDPYADLTEAAISTKPENWNGSDDQLPLVRGARLNNTNFRYAQAYGIFLANSHLWRADFEGAFLSEADMRSADLGQASLRLAMLDRAQMNKANLDRADLSGGNLTRTDLRGANLSYSSLANAMLVDTRLDGASLYSADLEGTTLIRASLEKADLRDARLQDANLEHADLQQAYLWSAKLMRAHLENAQLANAIFIDADLRGADLRGAQFQGTVLNGANLEDANLEGADLRGSLGLTARQVCSARTREGVLLDPAIQTQVDAGCGAAK
jgi:uncharacterized protein YjbI with pentapeptide repeats